MKLINFRLEELVGPETFERLGDNCWKLFNQNFLLDVDKFVSDLKRDLGVRGVTVNNWLWKGNFKQSGFREQNTSVGAPRSQHKQGNALDMKFNGCTVAQALAYLEINKSRYPFITTVENIAFTPTWLHVDGRVTDSTSLRYVNP
jgi:hypothetical protein